MPQQQIEKTIDILQMYIRRCEAIQPKFKEKTAQHTLLKNRIQALQIGKALLLQKDTYSYEALQNALPPIKSILHKCRKAQSKYEADTKQYNRYIATLQAMETIETAIEAEIKKREDTL